MIDYETQLLPVVTGTARLAFSYLDAESQDEAVAETIAHAFVAWGRLITNGCKIAAKYWALPKFAVQRVRGGRSVTGRLTLDVMSPDCQLKRGVQVETTDYRGLLDTTEDPAIIAGLRVDFEEWLDTLTTPKRRFIDWLTAGWSVSRIADELGCSQATANSTRWQLSRSWRRYQGEAIPYKSHEKREAIARRWQTPRRDSSAPGNAA